MRIIYNISMWWLSICIAVITWIIEIVHVLFSDNNEAADNSNKDQHFIIDDRYGSDNESDT